MRYKSIKEVLVIRDGLTTKEAEAAIAEARKNLHERLADGEMPFNILEEFFGLEADYLDELL